MKFYYTSDTHLDFYTNVHKGSYRRKVESLVEDYFVKEDSKESTIMIAGDISHYNSLTLCFLEELAKNYKYVICCLGNHDLYMISSNAIHKYHSSGLNRFKELSEKISSSSYGNIHLLDGNVLNIDSVIVGVL